MNRRDMFRGAVSGYVTALLARLPLRAAPRPPGIYARIGVRPVVNCRGTFTIVSGSQTLPEVKRAMEEASHHYVHLDELMDGVGRRLAELTRADWGIVTAGCAAALTHATAACIAGSDPEKMQRLPDLTGLKNEVVSPRPSRHIYDHAIRMLGVKVVTPTTREEYLAALRPSTAMVALLGETIPRHPMSFEEMTGAARQRGIPVLVDAAAERLTVPNTYLSRGADMVGYSGGKCFRGPQCAGLLLGRKDLVHAAWLNSAPHHSFGRPMKVGKEEIMGMLAAVEAWMKRDHDAEWKEWEGWLGTIREKVSSAPTVRTEILLPTGPSNYSPQLRIFFEPAKIGATGTEIAEALLEGDPRIVIPAGENHLTVMPYMMMPGEASIVAAKIHQALLNPPRREKLPAGASDAVLSGMWDVEIEFIRGQATHVLYLEERDGKVMGQHRSETLSGEVRGTREGSRVDLRSGHRHEGAVIGYRFQGALEANTMTGTLDLAQYGTARFTGRKRWA